MTIIARRPRTGTNRDAQDGQDGEESENVRLMEKAVKEGTIHLAFFGSSGGRASLCGSAYELWCSWDEYDASDPGLLDHMVTRGQLLCETCVSRARWFVAVHKANEAATKTIVMKGAKRPVSNMFDQGPAFENKVIEFLRQVPGLTVSDISRGNNTPDIRVEWTLRSGRLVLFDIEAKTIQPQMFWESPQQRLLMREVCTMDVPRWGWTFEVRNMPGFPSGVCNEPPKGEVTKTIHDHVANLNPEDYQDWIDFGSRAHGLPVLSISLQDGNGDVEEILDITFQPGPPYGFLMGSLGGGRIKPNQSQRVREKIKEAVKQHDPPVSLVALLAPDADTMEIETALFGGGATRVLDLEGSMAAPMTNRKDGLWEFYEPEGGYRPRAVLVWQSLDTDPTLYIPPDGMVPWLGPLLTACPVRTLGMSVVATSHLAAGVHHNPRSA
ncbi:MAG: hypothetical protein OXE50_08595 [Chloroflexi bacterium]|nr:hypothetical protein [Chloroflexota bacterium]